MRTITLSTGARLRTSAKARYLVVGQYGTAKPAVECTTNDRDRALANQRRLAAMYPHTTWLVVDQHPER